MNLGAELSICYRKQYRILAELSLATVPDGTTPDVAVYPAFALDYDHRTPRRADPPLACIEITEPPSQSNEEMVNKTGIFFAFGVKPCWIVVPPVRPLHLLPRRQHTIRCASRHRPAADGYLRIDYTIRREDSRTISWAGSTTLSTRARSGVCLWRRNSRAASLLISRPGRATVVSDGLV